MAEHRLVELAPVINSPGYPRRPQYAARCACGHVDVSLFERAAAAEHQRHLANPDSAPGAGDG
ncbi:hypothetical protein ACL02T_32225 [Pseudonocardia sp. RS010]|uniref:hypothetical protein n=1 Tax=Pseudonocardia sp. RS010 TaxID=3385979 RepID=UPI0039A3C66B